MNTTFLTHNIFIVENNIFIVGILYSIFECYLTTLLLWYGDIFVVIHDDALEAVMCVLYQWKSSTTRHLSDNVTKPQLPSSLYKVVYSLIAFTSNLPYLCPMIHIEVISIVNSVSDWKSKLHQRVSLKKWVVEIWRCCTYDVALWDEYNGMNSVTWHHFNVKLSPYIAIRLGNSMTTGTIVLAKTLVVE